MNKEEIKLKIKQHEMLIRRYEDNKNSKNPYILWGEAEESQLAIIKESLEELKKELLKCNC